MRKILTALLICSALFARSEKASDIPPASEVYINLEPAKCDDAIMKRIGELLQIVDDNTHESNPDYIELMILTDLVEAYEDMYYPIENTLSSQSLPVS